MHFNNAYIFVISYYLGMLHPIPIVLLASCSYSLVYSRSVKFQGLAKFISDSKMGQKKVQMAEHPRLLTLLQKEDYVIAVARDIDVS